MTQPRPTRRTLMFAAAATAALAAPWPARARDDAQAAADRLLDAVGGRARWAGLRNTRNDSQQYRTDEPREVRAVILMDFERPRWRIDTTAPGLRLVRVFNQGEGWRLDREGRVQPPLPATRQADIDWHAGHLYRTLHRVARRDALLALRWSADERLEVHEGGRRIAWLRLDSAGEPYAYGGLGDGPGSLSGPWKAVVDGVHHPVWTAQADGRWRSTLNRLELNVDLSDADFRAPA